MLYRISTMNDKAETTINPITETNSELTELADLCKALSHPARIRIVLYLRQMEQCVCGQIVDQLPLGPIHRQPASKSFKKCRAHPGNCQRAQHLLLPEFEKTGTFQISDGTFVLIGNVRIFAKAINSGERDVQKKNKIHRIGDAVLKVDPRKIFPRPLPHAADRRSGSRNRTRKPPAAAPRNLCPPREIAAVDLLMR